jgi:hypothetical protein
MVDGSVRDSDNWQKGMPQDVYVKSLLRHVMDVWLFNRGLTPNEPIDEALCAVIFNSMGLLNERLKGSVSARATEVL